MQGLESSEFLLFRAFKAKSIDSECVLEYALRPLVRIVYTVRTSESYMGFKSIFESREEADRMHVLFARLVKLVGEELTSLKVELQEDPVDFIVLTQSVQTRGVKVALVIYLPMADAFVLKEEDFGEGGMSVRVWFEEAAFTIPQEDSRFHCVGGDYDSEKTFSEAEMVEIIQQHLSN